MSAPTAAITAPSGHRASAVRDTATLAGRILTHWRQRPVSILLGFLFPVLMVLMFGYLFGGAMSLPGGDYMDFLIPGMLTMTMLFGLESLVVSVAHDTAKGVTERIRSLPVGTAPALAGRSAADMLNALVGLAVMIGTGLLVGWRPERGLAPALAAAGLLLWLRWAFTWVGVHLGLLLRTPESAVAVQVVVWPVGFLSSVYVSPDTMPGWLGAIATWNPLTATATAIRELFGNPGWNTGGWAADHAIALALIWPALLTLVFVPLACRQYGALAN
ncbi:ABC transporter permease [Streptomyces sp. NPDC050560]|uniref:ABC transporter permease n=1 Tax=Streptomyces sp. NPDC050560 TaxID=3365630 RepID=UPI0037A1A080